MSTFQLRSSANIFYEEMERSIGAGALRFAPDIKHLKSVAAQLEELTDAQKDCFASLKVKWEAAHPEMLFPDEMYLRFARCSPGQAFDEKSAWKVMKSFEQRYAA